MAHQISWHFQPTNRRIPVVSIINSASCQSILSSTFPWHTANRIDFFQVIFLCFWFLPHNFQPFTNLLVLRPKTVPCPEAAQATTAAVAAAEQAANHGKAFPKPLQAGFWLAAILTRSERGANEVQNYILGDWPPKSPDKPFSSHMLAHSFQNSKTQELSAVEHGGAEEQIKPSSSCRQEQGDKRGDKGRVRETEGRQRDASLANKAAVTNLSGYRLFETYCKNRHSQVSIVYLCKVPKITSIS